MDRAMLGFHEPKTKRSSTVRLPFIAILVPILNFESDLLGQASSSLKYEWTSVEKSLRSFSVSPHSLQGSPGGFTKSNGTT